MAAEARVLSNRAPSAWRFANPLVLARDLWSHRDLVRQLTMREILGRYRGSYFGAVWSFLTPLLMLVVYTIVFGAIFRRSWSPFPGAADAPRGASDGWAGHLEFALTVFCGLLVFNVFSECVSKAPNLVVRQPNFVKKVVFPVEVLPVAVLGSSLAHAAVGLWLLVVGLALLAPASFSLAMLWFPVVLLPLAMLCLGLGWILSSLGVFVRDIEHPVGVSVTMLFFLSAIFYSPYDFPDSLRWMVWANPLALLIEDARRTLLWGLAPNWPHLAASAVLSAALMQLGFVWFMKSRRWFSDVL
jgi:lipopolysaccharide transport system permease protein